MRSVRTIHVVSAHAEGEVGDVVVGGVEPPPGDTLSEQAAFLARDRTLWRFLLNEPRGGVFRHVNLLVPARHPDARMGFIIMEPEDLPPMSGSNTLCVATVLLETGIIAMEEPETIFALEAPGGLVRIRAACSDGRAQSITLENLPSFAVKQGIRLDVPGIGCLTVDTAFGGDSFVVVDAAELGVPVSASQAGHLATCGMQVLEAANAQIGFCHPHLEDRDRLSFCLVGGPLERIGEIIESCQAVVIRPGRIDRSPTGTAVSARMALLHARGAMASSDIFHARSIIGSRFAGRVIATTRVGSIPAIIPQVTGRAWITGTHQHLLDPDDPWPEGYRLGDTWGHSGASQLRQLPAAGTAGAHATADRRDDSRRRTQEPARGIPLQTHQR